AKGGDAWFITVTLADFKKIFFLQFFPRAEQERLKREYHSIRQTSEELSWGLRGSTLNHLMCMSYMDVAKVSNAARNYEILHERDDEDTERPEKRSTLNHLMCMPFMDVAQVANAARNYEILHERDDDDAERPDKRQKSGDRHQPTSQQSSHRNHGHNNDRHGSDRQGGSNNHRSSSNNNYSGNNNRNSGNGRDQRNRGILVMGVTKETGVSSPTDLSILVSSSPGVLLRATPTQFALRVDADTQESVVELLVLNSPGVPLKATPTQFALRVDAGTQESVVELLADKKPCASGRVFAITEDHAIKTSEPGYETVGFKDMTCEDWIREEIREEFRTGSGSSNAGGNHPPVTIHTWLERFNKQKPHSFEKATAPVDAENWISHMEKIFDVMGCEDAFKTRLAVYKFEGNALAWWKAYKQAKGGDAWLVTERLKMEYHSVRQTSSETSTELLQRFLRLVGFLGAAAGTEEEQAKNFQWGLRRNSGNGQDQRNRGHQSNRSTNSGNS
nr:hypothetical protein [Tanacetum cinerariifolium]